jgi:hypothetical protein
MEMLGNLLFIEEAIVSTAHESQSLKVVRIFQTKREQLIVRESFDDRGLEG